MTERAGISRQLAMILALLAWSIFIPFVHGVIPWATSLSMSRHGWGEAGPGLWNLPGLIPVISGVAGLVWVFVTGNARAGEMPGRVSLDWTPKLLLHQGPYAFSRNPMYVAELIIWFGWAVFYGSVAIAIGVTVMGVAMNYVVQREERDLVAKFGDTYVAYQAMVPRWLRR